jgi:FXSXX-COOH protein
MDDGALADPTGASAAVVESPVFDLSHLDLEQIAHLDNATLRAALDRLALEAECTGSTTAGFSSSL